MGNRTSESAPRIAITQRTHMDRVRETEGEGTEGGREKERKREGEKWRLRKRKE